MSRSGENQTVLASLRLRWGVLLLAGAALILGGELLFSRVWQPDLARTWALLGALALAYQLARLWPDLALNHRVDEAKLLPTLGLGSVVSLARLLAFALLAGFLAVPLPPGLYAWLPVALNLIANFSDFFDGYLARISDHVTALGQKLDMDLDGRGLLVVTLLAYQYGTVPWWFLPVGFARYAFLLGLWWRERQGKPIYALAPSNARRVFAGVQMGFATAMLAPAFAPPETTLAATLFMLPFLNNFLVDWWQVSGRVGLQARWSAVGARFWRAAAGWPAAALRIVLALGLLSLLRQPISPVFAAIELVTAIALALGAAGRVAATTALITLGFRLSFTALGPVESVLLIGLTAQMFLGTGPYSLWRPEDSWITRRAGERLA